MAVPPSLSAQDAGRDALRRLVSEPLPDGSIAQSSVSFYTSDNLYEYMDGGADIFVLYGVKTLLHLDAKVYVSSVGETRNQKNQALLESAGGYGGE